ncbi:MAG: hypothetical protein ACLSAP_02745 [Oscillospiraceae bacterium]
MKSSAFSPICSASLSAFPLTPTAWPLPRAKPPKRFLSAAPAGNYQVSFKIIRTGFFSSGCCYYEARRGCLIFPQFAATINNSRTGKKIYAIAVYTVNRANHTVSSV